MCNQTKDISEYQIRIFYRMKEEKQSVEKEVVEWGS